VRQGGRGKPQPWRAGSAAVRAMERLMACYGIPEPMQTHKGVEFTSRDTSCRRVQSGSETFALLEQFLNSHAMEHRLSRFERLSATARSNDSIWRLAPTATLAVPIGRPRLDAACTVIWSEAR
jgi:hypothetical protein